MCNNSNAFSSSKVQKKALAWKLFLGHFYATYMIISDTRVYVESVEPVLANELVGNKYSRPNQTYILYIVTSTG